MHDFEGIHAIAIDTFSDMLDEMSRDSNDSIAIIKELKEQHIKVQENYEQMIHVHDLLLNLFGDTKTMDDLKSKYLVAKQMYDTSESELQQNLKSNNNNNNILYIEFINTLDLYNINLNYCMSGSVAGGTCGRIDNSRENLSVIAEKQQYIRGILWSKILCNLAYVHDMSKIKNKRPLIMHDKCTIKHAYIDLYHCFLIAVLLWRKDGSIGQKIHLVWHEINRMFANGVCCGHYDDQRIENCHQNVLQSNMIYNKYHGSNKILLQVKAMNTRCLGGID
jgi:hypothetical protein